jgi:hypothetical protein
MLMPQDGVEAKWVATFWAWRTNAQVESLPAILYDFAIAKLNAIRGRPAAAGN